MKITELPTFSKKSVLDLEVEASGRTLTVKSGIFKFQGEDYSFPEDLEYTVGVHQHKAWLEGHIFRNKDTGEAMLIVDEFVQDGVDQQLDCRTVPHTYLDFLFLMEIPPQTQSLDGLEIKLRKLRPRPAQNRE